MHMFCATSIPALRQRQTTSFIEKCFVFKAKIQFFRPFLFLFYNVERKKLFPYGCHDSLVKKVEKFFGKFKFIV